jgi:hypothetical protein
MVCQVDGAGWSIDHGPFEVHDRHGSGEQILRGVPSMKEKASREPVCGNKGRANLFLLDKATNRFGACHGYAGKKQAKHQETKQEGPKVSGTGARERKQEGPQQGSVAGNKQATLSDVDGWYGTKKERKDRKTAESRIDKLQQWLSIRDNSC